MIQHEINLWQGLKFIGIAAMIFSLALPGLSQDGKEEFTPYHTLKLRYAGNVQISPDGEQVAYTLSRARNPFEQEDGSRWDELYVVDEEGQSKPFVTGKVNVSSVQWTPDGKYISFLMKDEDDEQKSLYAIPIDGGEAKKLLEHDTDIISYDWRPDGKKVAFIAKPGKSETVDQLEEEGFNQEVFEEDWRHNKMWTADPWAESPDPQMLDIEGTASEMHWGPEGERIAAAIAPTPLIDDHYMYRRVRVVDVASEKIVTKIDNPGKLGDVRWSPDGESIAMVSGVSIHDTHSGRIFVASAETGEIRKYLMDYKGHVSAIEWQNKNTILYLGDEGVWTTFNRIDRDGSNQKTFIREEGPILTGFALADDGKSVAFDGETPKHPDEVYRYKVNGKLEKVTDHNPWLSEMRFAEQSRITWEARDGLTIEGVLIKPLNYQEGKRYPLIMCVHGGPESHDPNGWLTDYNDPGQIAAAEGYFVLYPNYRGSTGRGVDFTRTSQNDPAGKEFDDLVDGIDHLVEQGMVDEDKVGITGGSYGGFASAWAATYYTDRYAASVMYAGISDRVSKMGTSDIPWELYLVHDSAWPWENWEHYRKTSPISYTEQAETPILIAHGKDDTRVFPGQSMELYRFLKVQDNVPVRLVFYPGEPHGNRRAASQLDYGLRLMRWMNHYLKGPGGEKPSYPIEYDQQFLTKLLE